MSAYTLQKVDKRKRNNSRTSTSTVTAGKYKQANNRTTEKQMKTWAEYFEELLNRPTPLNAADIHPAEETLQLNSAKPTKDEVRRAIRTLKNGKSAGPDGVSAEATKADLSTPTNMFYEIIENIWDKEEIQEDWKEEHLVKLPK